MSDGTKHAPRMDLWQAGGFDEVLKRLNERVFVPAEPSRQLSLVPLAKPRLLDRVLSILRAYPGHWLAAYEVQKEVQERYGVYASESSIGARLRELRQPRGGSHPVTSRPRAGKRVFEYSLGGK